MPAVKALPVGAAITLAATGGAFSAAQSSANAALGERVGNAALGALANNVTGSLLVAAGLAALPGLRAGVRTLVTARLPWWAYLGGLGGAFYVAGAAFAVPVTGVAVFAIAQVSGAALGGLVVDRSGLAQGERRPVSGPRVVGAALGIVAVALAQAGRPVGDLALGALVLAVAAGLAVAGQAALNGRLAAVGSPGAATATNFVVSTPLLVGLAAATGGIGPGWPDSWPGQWYLYLGGTLGVAIVTIISVTVGALGVLRMNLSMIGGQLVGAILLDALLPGGAAPTLPVLAGAALTVVAVALAGRRARTIRPVGAP